MLIKAMFGLMTLIMIHSANAHRVIEVDNIEEAIRVLQERQNNGETQLDILNQETQHLPEIELPSSGDGRLSLPVGVDNWGLGIDIDFPSCFLVVMIDCE